MFTTRFILPELKLSFFRRLFEPVLGNAELSLILFVQLDALSQSIDKFGVRQFPKALDRAAGNKRTTCLDQLVRDFDEQRRETFRCVIVA